jgi:hypothetical protein
MLLKISATRTPQGALKFVALIIKILSCNKNLFFHGLRSKLPQLFYFNSVHILSSAKIALQFLAVLTQLSKMPKSGRAIWMQAALALLKLQIFSKAAEIRKYI